MKNKQTKEKPHCGSRCTCRVEGYATLAHTRTHWRARGICGARVRGRPLRRPESFYLSPTMRLPRRWRRPRLIEPAAAPANPPQSADYTNTAADNATTMLSQQWSGTGADNGYANVASDFSPTSFLVILYFYPNLNWLYSDLLWGENVPKT